MTQFQGAVGVAGCGAMGLPMAKRLRDAGFATTGFDVRPIADADFAPNMVADPAAFAAGCEVLISVVRDETQTLDLLLNKQALLKQPKAPKIVVISSTLSPRFIRELRTKVTAEVQLIDAPMSGAPFSAQNGTLTFMVGGEEASVAYVKQLFYAMGIDVHHLGGLSMGMTAKVLNNLVAASSVAATRRALLAADALGLPREKLLAVMQTSSGQNWFASNFERVSWAREGYSTENTMGILEKDVASMMDGTREAGLAEPHLEKAVIAALRAL
jgi:3-hydroxyisobutyrate dehydrogenase-like beta-hydroxyacid dehydrogenase